LLNSDYTQAQSELDRRFNSATTTLKNRERLILSEIKQSISLLALKQVVSTIENVNGDKYQNFIYPKPPINEQQQIVEYMDKQTEEIDTLIQLEQKKIDILKEYRQSLVSEVVTGKIRVCEEDNSLSLNSQIV
jgi:restriction endonuclease S subunit